MNAPQPHTPTQSFALVRVGFTLIEFLVTVGIIVALVGLAMPIFSGMRKHSDQTLCTSRLKSLGVAFFAYANDNDGVLPVIDYVSAGGELKSGSFWGSRILPYIGATDLNDKGLKCPTIASKRGATPTSSPWSYTLNNGLADLLQPSGGGAAAKIGKRSVAILSPSKAVMLFCSPRAWTSVSRQNDIASGGPGRGYGNIITPQSASSFFGEVHRGKANVLFGDGHVAPFAFLEVNFPNQWEAQP